MNDDQFFEGLIGELGKRSYEEHPPANILRRYVQRRLPEGKDFPTEVKRLLSSKGGRDWTLSEVSLHVATCGECAPKVTELRAACDLVLLPRKERGSGLLSRKTRKRLAYSIPLAIIVALGLLIIFFPRPRLVMESCIYMGQLRLYTGKEPPPDSTRHPYCFSLLDLHGAGDSEIAWEEIFLDFGVSHV